LAVVLREQPDNAQAWLTQASIQQVQGHYEQAARSCAHLHALGAALYADACLAEIDSLTGRVDEAEVLLEHLSRDAAGEPPGLSATISGPPGPAHRNTVAAPHDDAAPRAAPAWLLLMRAELAERRGDAAVADRLYQAALAQGPDAYTLGAYADFLLDQGRPREVLARLAELQRVDALLLRLALAYQALQAPQRDAAVTALQARFDAARLRGDTVHQREEARFLLQLRGQPEAALQVALANWAVQKEPADARLVLEAARAAQRDATAEPVRAALRASGLVDQRLKGLL
jgi:Tfp pilus assembly protein PilF